MEKKVVKSLEIPMPPKCVTAVVNYKQDPIVLQSEELGVSAGGIFGYIRSEK